MENSLTRKEDRFVVYALAWRPHTLKRTQRTFRPPDVCATPPLVKGMLLRYCQLRRFILKYFPHYKWLATTALLHLRAKFIDSVYWSDT